MSDAVTQNPQQLADQIAAALDETNPGAVNQIRKLIQAMGEDFAQAVLQETLEVERNGGMMLEKHNRRRTPGGVYLYLARGKLPYKKRAQIFPEGNKAHKIAPDSPEPASQAAQEPVEEIEITAETRLAAENIAGQLQEADPERLVTIARLIDVGGAGLAQDALATALEMESQGGMRKKDGTRRSPGGAFLYIASRWLSEAQRQQVWPVLPDEMHPPDKDAQPKAPAAAPVVPKPPAPAGTATTAKMTLVGRPASFDVRQGFVQFRLESSKAPNLPKGLPTPQTGSVFTVHVAHKQWAKVAATVDDPLDALIIEGYPVLDAKNGKLVLLATNVISKLAQQNRKK